MGRGNGDMNKDVKKENGRIKCVNECVRNDDARK